MSSAQTTRLTIEGRPEHPIVYLTKDDIARGRANRDKYPWAKKAAEKIFADADKWERMSDDQLIALVPPPKSCYAYGFAGCPICGGKFAAWWGADGVASIDDLRHVKCVNGHRLPDDEHPDPGDGYVDASGKKYYLVGTYNAFVIDTLTTATTKLCYAWALSGDAKYANKAALLLDNLARIYPTSETGSWDYPSTPPSGRFNRPWYQVARTLVLYVNQYDILMSAGDVLGAPSSNKGMTRRENIEKNLLLNGAAYCYRESLAHPSLNNGQCDYIRGPMAVGAAMGIPQYVAWGADGPYSIRSMIENNIDRDGQYYETSTLYSDHSRNLYIDIAEILQHYRDAAHPGGIKLANDPKFQALYLLPRTRLRVGNHSPTWGDDAPNVERIGAQRAVDRLDLVNLERLRALSGDAKLEAKLAAIMSAADVESAWADNLSADWLLFHVREIPKLDRGAATRPVIHPLTGIATSQSDLLSQKGFAMLRAGSGGSRVAATLRFGPTLNHGHLDEMNLSIYARGYDMTYDLGYSLGSTHTQVGWAHTTASHNTVLVDETPQLGGGRSGGSLKMFVSTPGLSLVCADDPACYDARGVSRYERTLALIGEKTPYLLDIFRVEGGDQHDYVFHARGSAAIQGLQLGPEGHGSLAGEDVNWSEKIGSDGNISGVLGREYWNPPPGNGLGFLAHPRFADAKSATWSATWKIASDTHVRLTMLPTPEAQVISVGDAPGIYPHEPKASCVLVRQRGEILGSTFVSVIEPFGSESNIRKIQKLDAGAVQVLFTDGRKDVLRFNDVGEFQRVGLDATDQITAAAIVGGTNLKARDLQLSLPASQFQGEIAEIDYERNILRTKLGLPAGDALAGQFLIVSNPAYAQSSGYRIAKVTREGELTSIQLAPTRLSLGRGHLDADPTDAGTLSNVVPLEYAKAVGGKASGFFLGKFVTNSSGTATRIRDVTGKDGMKMTVESTEGFKAGDDLIIYDIRPGDTLTIPCFTSIRRLEDGRWSVTGNAEAKLSIGGKRIELVPAAP